jgi:microcystin degradation protein MlrC
MGDLSDCMIFYRECPHTDAFDSAVLSSELLARCLKTGVRPKHFVLVTPIVWPPTGTGTRDGPMRALEDAARRMEKTIPGVLAVNVVGAYDISMCRMPASRSASSPRAMSGGARRVARTCQDRLGDARGRHSQTA